MNNTPQLAAPNEILNVLIVDDEQDIREMMAILLKELGFATLLAADGFKAMEAFHRHKPHIVLTDIKMPGKDGIAVLKEVKAACPETEVIMISGHGDMHLAVQSLKHDAADFITKPIDEELLEIALAKVSERIRLRRQVREHTENLENLVREKSAALVEMERRLAATQIMEGMGRAMTILASDPAAGEYFPEMPFYVAIHDAVCNVVTVNQAYQQRFGDRVGLSSCKIYERCGEPGWKSPVREAADQQASIHRHENMIAKDQTWLPVITHVSPVTGVGGKLELLLEIAVDISEMRRLQDELSRTQRKFERFFNTVPCAITVQDKNLQVVESNASFRKDFGEPQCRPCHQLYKRSDEPCTDCPVLATFEDQSPHQYETVVTTRGGENRNILVWTAPLADADGEVNQVLEVATDITQIRQLQDHLSSLGIMLGSMSHGVKGLLMAIDGGAYRVDKGLEKGDLQRVAAGWKTVRHRLDHMRRTVMDILYYSKSREPDLSPHALRGLAEHLAETVAAKASKAGIAFQTDFSQAEGTILIDEVAFSSAMVNILENAVDACLFNRNAEEHKIEFVVLSEDDQAVFRVRDNGIGMDQETRDNMFTLFFSSKGALGTGIGMFVTHEIVTAHGGNITVDSAPGKGTTFRVAVPLAESTETARHHDQHLIVE
ncbi:Response regulator containing CheY-like receiver, AAA-type ATPase, and DNA-binding domains [Desulfonatronum thiosulfatophilum]|uniref:histidine kinase n=1 Tax=Desulfonatronum thiosulfatophilum TaxID=617002 RepID=A0A1G6CYG1_9BACT|nr:response regulator [Desulfonatronum thiosulfatophilum]SDB37868.1 Response regulator containing CheY-like receiver, AAA-type ATPase, and DNA-binding domains [Desulfonatronum thiosulfatophilum]